MKNRFVIFVGDYYYPQKNGIHSGYPTLEEAKSKLTLREASYSDSGHRVYAGDDSFGWDWSFIVDMETLEEVYELKT